MTRTNIYAYDEYQGKQLIGWFDQDAAECFRAETEWDGNNHIDINTDSQFDHQMLLRTAGGRWVLHTWSQWQGRGDSNEFVTDERAREWLIANHDDEAVARYFTPVEPERGPGGRPEIGPPINTRLDPETLATVAGEAERAGVSRAEMIRRLVDAGLAARVR